MNSSNHDQRAVIALGGFAILRTTAAALIPQLQKKMHSQQLAFFFANTNFIVQCQPLKKQMFNSNTIIVNDGIGMDIACQLIHGQRFIENLNGTDFTPHFLQSMEGQARVFLVGAKPGVAQRAADYLSNKFALNVVGVCNGYDEAKDTTELISAINNSGANVVLVAMGNPHQERWILQHRQQLNARILMGVGALFDFLAGDKARAPALVQRLRMEWFYRLCLEPSRLLRRYSIDIVRFLIICLRTGKQTGPI
jgi:beta-1,4-glucosyltransferase